MKEDIENYSPTSMFRGTPCMSNEAFKIKKTVLLRFLECKFKYSLKEK